MKSIFTKALLTITAGLIINVDAQADVRVRYHATLYPHSQFQGAIASGTRINDQRTLSGAVLVRNESPYPTAGFLQWRSGAITRFYPQGGSYVSLWALNNLSSAAGSSSTCLEVPVNQPFSHTPFLCTDEGSARASAMIFRANGESLRVDTGGRHGTAFGINDLEDTVGAVRQDGRSLAFFAEANQAARILEIPAADSSLATAVNNRKEIVGWYFDSAARQIPFFAVGNEIKSLDAQAYQSLDIFEINEQGVAAGYAAPTLQPERAALFHPTRGITLLPEPHGLENFYASEAYGLNDRNEVTGVIETRNGPEVTNRGYVWVNELPIDLTAETYLSTAKQWWFMPRWM